MAASSAAKDLAGLMFSPKVGAPDLVELPPSVDASSFASIAPLLAAAVTLGLSILIRAEWRSVAPDVPSMLGRRVVAWLTRLEA